MQWQAMQSLEPAVYTVAQVARLLGLSRSNAYARIRDGAIPSIKIGNRTLIPESELHRFVNAQLEKATK